MKYIFYIDQETVSCDSNTIESLIEDNCNSFIRTLNNTFLNSFGS